jgi:branched-subunit amino acid transport protein
MTPIQDPASFGRFIICLLVMALVTYLLRFLPMLIFRRKIKNRYIKSFLYYVPYSVLSVMSLPGIFYSTGHLASGIAACACAVLLSYFKRSLIVVAAGAAAAALIAELIITYIVNTPFI